MHPLSLSKIVDLAGAKLESGDSNVSVEKISTDSRTLKRGELFVALRGENFDGHKFVEAAVKAGAVGAIVDLDWKGKVPDNFTVIRVEDTAERDGRVEIRVAVEPGTSVRHAGSDIRRGDLVAERGRLVTPGLIGVLASTGRTAVRTIRRPRVTLLTTGDELRDAGESLGPGQITNTNRYTIRAALEEAGAEVVDAGVARDVREELVARLQSAALTDLIVSTGGVSMGAYDLVRALLEEQGAVDFWQVALRPGKPLMVGTVGGRPLIGLPGNPVSSLVGVELFVRPAILKMQGRTDLERPRIAAITDVALSNPPHLEQYFRGVARRDGDRIRVRLTGDQGSHVLRSMADANCLIVVPQGTSEVAAGAAVEIIPLAPID